MDVQMPEVDGLTATLAIRALEERPRRPHPDRRRDRPRRQGRPRALPGRGNGCLPLQAPPRARTGGRARLAPRRSTARAWGRVRRPCSRRPPPRRHRPRPRGRAAGGDEELFADVVALHLDELPQLLDALRDAARRCDAQRVSSSAHRLRGLAKTFDAFDAAAAATSLEEGALAGDLSGVAAVEVEFDRLRAALGGLKHDNRPARP